MLPVLDIGASIEEFDDRCLLLEVFHLKVVHGPHRKGIKLR